MGHLAGDLTLRELAGRLRSEVCRDDLLARYGGEEFAAVLTEISCRTLLAAHTDRSIVVGERPIG